MSASADGRDDAPEPGRLGKPTVLVTEDGRHGRLGHGQLGQLGHGQLGHLDRQGRPGQHNGGAGESGPPGGEPSRAGLLDSVAGWPATQAPAGTFRLEPVRLDRDLRLIAGWMNASVSAFLSAGFRLSEKVELPEKRAALPVRDRAMREQL
jgi:hypothetical protein